MDGCAGFRPTYAENATRRLGEFVSAMPKLVENEPLQINRHIISNPPALLGAFRFGARL
jgi:hypothetical protein